MNDPEYLKSVPHILKKIYYFKKINLKKLKKRVPIRKAKKSFSKTHVKNRRLEVTKKMKKKKIKISNL